MCLAHDHTGEYGEACEETHGRSMEQDREAHFLAMEPARKAGALALYRNCAATHLALGQRIYMAEMVARRLKEREGK